MKPLKTSLALTVVSASLLSAIPVGNAYAAYSLMLSTTATRSTPVSLNGNTVNGQIYVFAAPTTGVKGVRFYLDDPQMATVPISTDWAAPYDFVGTTDTNLAMPYDTSKLATGNHTITARVSLMTGAVETVTAAFTKASPPTPTPTPAPTPTATPTPAYSLMLSTTATRSAPVSLNGTAVNGQIYVFAASTNALKGVRFYLDDPQMATAPISTDWAAPYDFVGTTDTNLAMPYDTSKLAAGSHTITARFSLMTGAVGTVTAAFTKASTATPAPTPTATPAPTPVPTPTPTPKPYGTKWHPGHYLNAYWGNSMSWSISRVKNNPYLKGVMVIHGWWELEPSKGVYDFSRIDAELAAAKAANKQLIIMFADRTFKGQDCVPAYVKSDPIYKGGQYKPTSTNCVALRWVSTVQDRLIALFTALGKRYNSAPNFEAFSLGEDSAEAGPYYSSRGYIDQEKRGMAALAKAFPNTVVFKSMNWGPGTGELFEYAYQLGLGVDGPDLMPHRTTYASPYYPQYAGKMPLGIGVEDPMVQKTMAAGVTVERLFDFAITDPKGLNVNYIVWDQPESSLISYSNDVLPMINATKGYVNSGCPLNITCQ